MDPTTPPPSSPKGLLALLGILLLVALVIVVGLGDAWMRWFPRPTSP